MAKNAVTLFSGLGSSSKALRDLGYDVVPHDIMPEAVATLKANGFDLAQQVDVRDIDWSHSKYADTEVVVGGPPCQPFSQAHNGDGQYDERDMILEFIRAVRELRPKLFVMEEVKTLTWPKHRAYLDKVIADMRDLGYQVEYDVLDASDYGIGQARKRLFIVGKRLPTLSEAYIGISWPVAESSKVSMADALGWTMEEAWRRNHAAPEPARVGGSDPYDLVTVQYGPNGYHAYPAWLHPDLDWVYSRPAPTVVGSFRPDVAARPGWRKPGDGPRQNAPGSVVTTLEERLALQDMPRDWVVKGSESKRALQVGNSVPCGLIRRVIEANQ